MSNNIQNPPLEQLIDETDELLRCVRATAYESADNLKGSQRDHSLSVVHLLEVIQGKVNQMAQIQAGRQITELLSCPR